MYNRRRKVFSPPRQGRGRRRSDSRSPARNPGRIRRMPSTDMKRRPPPRRSRSPSPRRSESRSRSPPFPRSRRRSPPPKSARYSSPREEKMEDKAVRLSRRRSRSRSVEKYTESRSSDYRNSGSSMYDPQELKRITVDVRRNTKRKTSPIIRTILNPDDIRIVRRPGEGARPIFDRDELRSSMVTAAQFPEVAEERRVILATGSMYYPSSEVRLTSARSRSRSRARSRSPRASYEYRDKFASDDLEPDLRQRINEKRQEERWPAGNQWNYDKPTQSFTQGNARDENSGEFHRTESSQGTGLQTTKPWETDPGYTPKGRSYFEHDNRDTFRRMPNRGNYNYRGRNRGGGYSRGGGVRFVDRRASPTRRQWTHDLYEKINTEEEPSSTT